MSTPRPDAVSFEEALRHVGEFGPAQIRNVLLTGAAWLPTAYVILLMVFNNLDPVQHHHWRCTSTSDVACSSVHQLRLPGARFCSLNRTQWDWTSPGNSVISGFDLYCDDGWKVGWSSSMFFFGFMLGSGAFGSMADSWGRKKSLICSSTVTGLCCLACSVSQTYWPYLLFRTLSGFGAAGMGLSGYILGTEPVGTRYRTVAALVNQLLFVAGEILLVAIAWVLPNWRSLQLTAALLCFLVTIDAYFLPESPRWLLAKGRTAEATAILQCFAGLNKGCLPCRPLTDATKDHQEQLSLWTVVASDRHILRRFLVLGYAWMVLCSAFYGISIALSQLHASPYITFLVGALVEIPAYLSGAYCMDRLGRHITMATGMMIAAIGCAACTYAPAGAAQIALAAMGKFGSSSAFAMASVYTSELFPTLVRSAVLGSMNQAARIGAMLSPLIVMAGGHTPFLIFGLSCALGSLGLFTLPETLGLALPDTVQELRRLQSIFSMWEAGQQRGWRSSMQFLLRTHASGASAGQAAVGGGTAKGGYAPVSRDESEMRPLGDAWGSEEELDDEHHLLLAAPEPAALHKGAA